MRWRRWWITYALVYDTRDVRAPRYRAGPFLTRRIAEGARRSIWRDKREPPHVAIMQEPK